MENSSSQSKAYYAIISAIADQDKANRARICGTSLQMKIVSRLQALGFLTPEALEPGTMPHEESIDD